MKGEGKRERKRGRKMRKSKRNEDTKVKRKNLFEKTLKLNKLKEWNEVEEIHNIVTIRSIPLNSELNTVQADGKVR